MKSKDLNKLTVAQLQEHIEELEKRKDKATVTKQGCWEIGKEYCIRTVTMIQVGTLEQVGDKEIVLRDAAWVADTGRWTDFLAVGKVNEVEPFPDGAVIIGRGSIIDACIWKHGLLRSQK